MNVCVVNKKSKWLSLLNPPEQDLVAGGESAGGLNALYLVFISNLSFKSFHLITATTMKKNSFPISCSSHCSTPEEEVHLGKILQFTYLLT